MPLQWRNQFWQSLEESAGKRCSECDVGSLFPASLSCTFLQTPSIVFRHLSPNSEHRFRHRPPNSARLYFRAAVHRRCQCPPKVLGPNKTESNTESKNARKHETRPPRVEKKEEFRLDSNDLGFIGAGVSSVRGDKGNV